MKHACQISLHDRLSAMFRGLSGVMAASMVFSLVFFSPLIDTKDTIAAAAQSRSDRAERNERRSERRTERAERQAERQAEQAERRSERAERQSEARAERRSERSEGRGGRSSNKSASTPGNSQPDSNTGAGKNSNTAKDINSNSVVNVNSGTPASEKPASGTLIGKIFGEQKFSGDSEPSGGALSEQEEREAIQNGWK